MEAKGSMEPAVFVAQPEHRRVNKQCSICGVARGVCTPCSWLGCKALCHPMCCDQRGYLRMAVDLGVFVREVYCAEHADKRAGSRAITDMLTQVAVAAAPDSVLVPVSKLYTAALRYSSCLQCLVSSFILYVSLTVESTSSVQTCGVTAVEQML
jgi:PHD-zinc-finger like domain